MASLPPPVTAMTRFTGEAWISSTNRDSKADPRAVQKRSRAHLAQEYQIRGQDSECTSCLRVGTSYVVAMNRPEWRRSPFCRISKGSLDLPRPLRRPGSCRRSRITCRWRSVLPVFVTEPCLAPTAVDLIGVWTDRVGRIFTLHPREEKIHLKHVNTY